MVLKPISLPHTLHLVILLQSNHYGIETKSRCNFLFQLLLQSNHYGIETCRLIFTSLTYPIVAIEPLWYWNAQMFYRSKQKVDALQSNHYGIETLKMRLNMCEGLQKCCNRTIMVLKYTINPSFCIERGIVAIEPLWYWNQILQNIKRKTLLSCNRTIMVLKFHLP